jgi:hypothetical protein
VSSAGIVSMDSVLEVWRYEIEDRGGARALVRPGLRAQGARRVRPAAGEAPLPILLGATLPLIVFAAAYLGFASFRAFVLTADLSLMTAIQARRAGGLSFLALYANGVLPGLFALPAGLGDIAIGFTAPWDARAVARETAFVTSRRFVIWNLLDILDLVIDVGTGALASGLLGVPTGGVTTAPMARLPLVLIPAYFVPLFVMLHIAALLQARRHVAAHASAATQDAHRDAERRRRP